MVGPRVSELVSARVEHVSFAATPCTMQVQRKRGAWAVVPLASATCDRLTTYLAGRTEGPLLLDAAGEALDRFDVVRITQRLARRGGLRSPDKVTPHVLRATAITSLLDSGAPLAEVQRWAGHARPETTQAYWERSNAVERDAALASRLAAMLDEPRPVCGGRG
ncbi:tyrosine-type recombinase/integrase [Actinopolymorpha pittospori]|uniref:tyrosine-type recombinase/integrase n=1 Tax=Actinopolymorpha pittospori TaxID=648752 RepID=UPI0017897316